MGYIGRFPVTALYVLSLASLWLLETPGAERWGWPVVFATPAFLITGYLRVSLGPGMAWAAPFFVVLVTLAVDGILAAGVRRIIRPERNLL